MDISSLAHRNTVSKSQVVQLEDGGDSSFYNPDIKYSTGKKLLKFLGHELVESALTKAPDPLPTPLPPEPLVAEPLVAEPLISAPIQPKQKTTEAAPTAVASSSATAPSLFVSKNIAWGLLFAGVAVFAFLGPLDFVKTQPNATSTQSAAPAALASADVKPAKEEAKALGQEPNSQASAASAPADTLAPNTATNTATNTPTTANTAAAQQPQDAVVAMSENAKKCLWKDAETELLPATPKKSAEYVYLVATKDLFVCVMDGNDRVAALTLKNGERRSIYGPAPFKVQSTQLAQLQVFFQGAPIALPSEDIKQIKLSAAPWK